MPVHRFERRALWMALAASMLCCACPDSRKPAGDGSVESGEWPVAGCTFGQDQTCNDDLAMSAISGRCSTEGTCSCKSGFAIRLGSGKCAAYTPKPGDACERSAGCNDNPISSARTGVCLSDGSCHCLG